ncbi:oxidoreductase [Amycolatopsis benzoatilytica]|uniref:oxidoreductase n=1 Tax=Amycolatopsis benzoatilytica TaxID=346045 RepID=UPI00035EB63B|nr:oxidoreductase [Amycolatopsis benzoatilytica]
MSPRVWLITGASSGFGRALAEAALAAGDTVAAAVRKPDSVADLVAAYPERAWPVQLDVTDDARVPAAVAEVLDRHGRIDVLVNNAGFGLVGAAEETTAAELRDLMHLHLFGPAELTRAVLPGMRERGTGAIVQLSSQGGRLSFGGISAYSATKFALEGWSEALAAEVKPFGIDVLIVEPGAFRTGFNKPGVLKFSEIGEVYREALEPVRSGLTGADGGQPGDPVRAAEAILTALAAEETPLRLPLGSDAVENISAALESARTELLKWEQVSRGADFPAGE